MTAPIFDRHGNVVAILSGSLNLLKPNFLGNLGAASVGKSGSFALFTRDRHDRHVARQGTHHDAGASAGRVALFRSRDIRVGGLGGSCHSRGLQAISATVNWNRPLGSLVASLPIDEAYAPIQATQRRIIEATLLLGL